MCVNYRKNSGKEADNSRQCIIYERTETRVCENSEHCVRIEETMLELFTRIDIFDRRVIFKEEGFANSTWAIACRFRPSSTFRYVMNQQCHTHQIIAKEEVYSSNKYLLVSTSTSRNRVFRHA